MRKTAAVAMSICLGLLAGCDPKDRAVVKGRLVDAWSQVSDKEFVRTRGIGAAPAQAQGLTHRRGLSRNSALVAARYEMLAILKGVKVTGGLTVGNLMERDSKIAEIANRIVHGAEEKSCEWTSDDGAVVTLELRRDRIEALVEQDKQWEPPTERQVFDAEQRRLDGAQMTTGAVFQTRPGAPSPGGTLALGLLFPGMGHLYAGGPDAGQGWYWMAGTLGLASVGAYFHQPHEVGETMADGTRRRERSEGLGLTFYALAAALHVCSAFDARNQAKVYSYFTMEPVRGGARFSISRKF